MGTKCQRKIERERFQIKFPSFFNEIGHIYQVNHMILILFRVITHLPCWSLFYKTIVKSLQSTRKIKIPRCPFNTTGKMAHAIYSFTEICMFIKRKSYFNRYCVST